MSLLNMSTSNFVLVKAVHVNPLNFSPYMLSLIVYYNGILSSMREKRNLVIVFRSTGSHNGTQEGRYTTSQVTIILLSYSLYILNLKPN